jgi:prevent-host-death family protein
MERTMKAADARRRFGEVLDEVADHGGHYVIERRGEPVAAVVPIHLYEKWKKERDAFFEHLAETAARVNMDEDEAMALALEAQRAVRAELQAERQRSATASAQSE